MKASAPLAMRFQRNTASIFACAALTLKLRRAQSNFVWLAISWFHRMNEPGSSRRPKRAMAGAC